MEGIVKWFNGKKGYGFIRGDDEQDYFVHYSSLEQGTFIRDNDRVSFDPAETDKGKQAQNVKLLQKASEMEQPAEEVPAEEPKEEAPAEEAQPEEEQKQE